MKVTLSIPDDTFDVLQALAGKDNVNKYITDRLDQLTQLDPKQKHLVLTQAQVRALQDLAGGTVFNTGDKLVEWVRNTQTVRFEDGCEVILNMDDLYTLQQQAQGMGAATFEDYLRDFIQESLTYSLYGAGRR